jgi:DoxX-like family
MKSTKIIYWVATIIIVLMEGVMPALTFNSDLAKQGISHLGYPDYFRVLLTVFKVCGAIVLLLPSIKGRLKEWAYAGFTFSLISATVSHLAIDGFKNEQSYFPLVVLIILMVSYFYYHKMQGSTK